VLGYKKGARAIVAALSASGRGGKIKRSLV